MGFLQLLSQLAVSGVVIAINIEGLLVDWEGQRFKKRFENRYCFYPRNMLLIDSGLI